MHQAEAKQLCCRFLKALPTNTRKALHGTIAVLISAYKLKEFSSPFASKLTPLNPNQQRSFAANPV
ncbi:MAG: hypothetical protein P3M72_00245 [Candidatus Hodgkinia cicadicola]|nr:MAG: hypothetical protein P3M72_00245 [Candidatus Hodgkinia cicadicola]